ncbi:MAG: PAS domain-containing protein [Proteobacteria bacterium]|nr:PAS domain-containing protein [Pseudomonadota bacterium]
MVSPAKLSDGLAEVGEVGFGFDELFFSRTDPAGIIKFGNSVFQRIAGYIWAELLEKPHKIIRHADMPRAVFWLLWDTIKKNQPIGAYVKNRANDGRHYWVFAIVTPVEGGYLSVRLKPSSPVFDVVRREYAALRALEREQSPTPQQSAELLLARLRELGFDDYSAFMATALGAEIAARDRQLGYAPDAVIQCFDDLVKGARLLLEHASAIASAYMRNESVPFNFRVLAAQLGQEGAAIGVISTNYTLLSSEMRTILAGFVESAEAVYRAINDGYFLACTARMQREVIAFFASEKGESAGREEEMGLLDRQQTAYGARSISGLTDIVSKIAGFQQACVEMMRLAAGLEVTRVMGKVECSRHVGVKERMDELLGDLETFQRTIAASLKEIEHTNHRIRVEADGLLARAKKVA